MDLPLVLDLALGLVLTYLTLSVLASEIQEILSSLLQWRAEHLKRSIEQLLEGDSLENTEAAQALATHLYDSPLIRSLNYEAKEGIAGLPRKLFHTVGALYRGVFRTRNPFGKKTSGPSFIPSETFAAALLERLNLEKFQQVFTENRLRQLFESKLWLPLNDIVNDLRVSHSDEYVLAPELKQFEQTLAQLYQDFQLRRITLRQTLQLALVKLDGFIEQAQTVLPAEHHVSQQFLSRVTNLKRDLALTDTEMEVLLQKVQPTLAELLQILDSSSEIYLEAKALAQQDGSPVTVLLDQLDQQTLPRHLQESLLGLAEQAQRTIRTVEDTLSGFEQEVAQWFDNAMERAGGVYKRNAKVVAILIGIAIAYTVNADTFHIANRLTNNQALRDSIAEISNQVDANSISADDPEQLRQVLDVVTNTMSDELDELSLPLGRRSQTLIQQQAAEKDWSFPIPRRVFGWIITGIAISMGANFWYGLLKRIINVRATGGIRGPQNSNGGFNR